MEKVVMMRSLYRSIYRSSLLGFSAAATTAATNHHLLSGGARHFHSISPNRLPSSSDCWPPFGLGIGSTRSFSEDLSHLPLIKDPEIEIAYKNLMASSWDEIPDTVIHDVKKALSKNTDDKAGQETLANAFREAEALEEFSGILLSRRKEIDDSIRNEKPLSDEVASALHTAYQRYVAYADSFGLEIGSTHSFSEDVSHLPLIKDPEIEIVFKDLMASSWDEIPDTVIHDAKKALSKNTDDKAGQEILANVFRAAEAVEEFSGILVSLRMEIDDSIGLSGENVKPLSDEFASALGTAYQRYVAYFDSFGPNEVYLRKKVETELGTRMIHLKMRCADLDSEWGKVSVLGTSGLSGSYVEYRA
ncbi:hypothetical protein LguiA_026148 [Lonicera macranthoides]